MKLRLRIRRNGEIVEEVVDLVIAPHRQAIRAAEAFVLERNRHLPVDQRETLLAVRETRR